MGLSLVRAALKNSALGGILESKKQELLISAIENRVQHALAPEAGTSAAADDPRGSAQHADGRPPPMGDMSPVETRVTDEALVTHDGRYRY